MKQRIDYLDIAKGIGILLMVSAHIYDNDPYQIAVYSFHMPLFILISGFLLGKSKNADKPFGAFFASKFKGLMVPYIITEICVLPLFYFKQGCQPADLKWIITDSLFLYYTRGSATWFLLSLFLSEVIFWLLRKCFQDMKLLAAICILLYILSACGYSGNHIATIVLRSLHGIFFLFVGYSVAHMGKERKLSTAQLGLLTIIYCFATLFNGKVAMVNSNYGNLALYTYTSLVGSYLVLLISKWLANHSALSKINGFIKYWAICILLYILSACGYSGNHIATIVLRSLHGIFFLFVGYSVAHMGKERKLSTAQLGLLTIIYCFATLFNGKVAMVNSNYGNLALYTYTSLVGSYLVLLISKWLANHSALSKINGFIKYWGRNSLHVVCAHLILLRYGIDWYFGTGPHYPFFTGSLIFGFVLLCEFLLIEAAGWFKPLLGQRCANRK